MRPSFTRRPSLVTGIHLCVSQPFGVVSMERRSTRLNHVSTPQKTRPYRRPRGRDHGRARARGRGRLCRGRSRRGRRGPRLCLLQGVHPCCCLKSWPAEDEMMSVWGSLAAAASSRAQWAGWRHSGSVYRLRARRAPRLLQAALSGTDADLSQPLSKQHCFWTPCGTSKHRAVRDAGDGVPGLQNLFQPEVR